MRRILGLAWSALASTLIAIVSPPMQLLFFGTVAGLNALATGYAPLVAFTAVAVLFGLAMLPVLLFGGRDPSERTLHTNASVAALNAIQVSLGVSIWTRWAPGNGWWYAVLLFLVAAIAWDLTDRARFVIRVRRAGGPTAAAREFAAAAVARDPATAHDAITRENVGRRGDSRLHWRYGEALGAENVALYEIEDAEAARRETEAEQAPTAPDLSKEGNAATGRRPGEPIPRPRRTDPAIVRAAAEDVAKECAAWAGDGRPEDWVEPLIRSSYDWDNGYDLAKSLERYDHVNPDAELVEILDGASHTLRQVHDEAVAKWVRMVGFEPAFAVGDLVSCPQGEGPVYSIEMEHARYVVDVERRGNGGYVIDAEKVAAIPTDGAKPAGAATADA